MNRIQLELTEAEAMLVSNCIFDKACEASFETLRAGIDDKPVLEDLLTRLQGLLDKMRGLKGEESPGE